jgi:hypothetical protein
MATTAAPGKASWTVMVLMGADNLLGEEDLSKAAKDDLAEMQEVGSDPEVLQIVVQIDRKQEFDGPKRFYFGKVPKNGPAPKRDEFDIPPGEATSGPSVLEDFIVWTKNKYAADHYLLVLWGHAYRLAFNRDPQRPDGLDFPDVRGVLERTNDGKRIDIVAFDSCNVSLLEAAYELRDVADYMVASQFIDPLPGWPYNVILKKVLESPDHFAQVDLTKNPPLNGPMDFGRAIVSQFVRHYEREQSVTMTMLDLSCVGEIGERVGELQTELLVAVRDDRAELAHLRASFQRSRVPIRQPSVDLLTFCWNLLFFSRNERVRIAAATLGNLLLQPSDPFVVAHARTDLVVGMLQGVSILAPNVISGFNLGNLRALYQRLDLSEHWGDLVFALANSNS